MTLSDGMRRFSPRLLRRAVRELLASRKLLHHPELAFLHDAYAVDGSEFPVINGMTLPKSKETLQSLGHRELFCGHVLDFHPPSLFQARLPPRWWLSPTNRPRTRATITR